MFFDLKQVPRSVRTLVKPIDYIFNRSLPFLLSSSTYCGNKIAVLLHCPDSPWLGIILALHLLRHRLHEVILISHWVYYFQRHFVGIGKLQLCIALQGRIGLGNNKELKTVKDVPPCHDCQKTLKRLAKILKRLLKPAKRFAKRVKNLRDGQDYERK